MPEMRINRALALLGYGSRRKVEQLVVAGRVKVNGTVITDLAARADPERDRIEVAGESAGEPSTPRFLAFYKPKGVLSTWSDERGRRCLADFFPERRGLVAVGRLDRRSEGLIVLTTDGELAHRLMHPSSGVPRTYEVLVAPEMAASDWQKLARGVMLEDGPVLPSGGEILERRGDAALLHLTLTEGRNRIVRRLLEHLGYEVLRLKRIAFGDIQLGRTRSGESRELIGEEVSRLKELASPSARNRDPGGSSASRGAVV